ncbi:MAG: hypothetical protein Q9162_000787 [Coniocarpon cinnabarinum]
MKQNGASSARSTPKRSQSTTLSMIGDTSTKGRPPSPTKPESRRKGFMGRTTLARPATMGPGSTVRPTSTLTPAARPTSEANFRSPVPKTPSASSTLTRSRPLSTAKTLGTGLRKRGQTPTSPRFEMKDPPEPVPEVEPEVEPETVQIEQEPENKPTSSAALRQRIAEAKAKSRNAQRLHKQSVEDSTPPTYEFENCEDPFNMKPKDGRDELQKRIEDARRDGRLNIAAMSLPAIPDEVMKMYDSEAMEQSSIMWNECVDLTRFIGADNDFVELSDTHFPDVSLADMADAEDSRGNMFGGLEHIDLHGNKLERLPLGLRHLSRLTSLNLSRNKLPPDAFNVLTQIPTLCELNLSNNALDHDLPATLGKLSLLEKLDVSHNKLSSLPSLRELSRLRILSVSHNRLQGLPFDALAKMDTLRELSASHNAFSGALIPSSVTEIPNLRVLDVSNNACASLTFSRTLKLPSLIRLDVSANRLGMFKDISEWSSLTTLIADDNCLREMPQGMTKLTQKLKIVSVERNTIPSIPEEVADMEALETLNLTGNPLYERRLVTLDVPGIKQLMMDKRDLSAKMSSSKDNETTTC